MISCRQHLLAFGAHLVDREHTDALSASIFQDPPIEQLLRTSLILVSSTLQATVRLDGDVLHRSLRSHSHHN